MLSQEVVTLMNEQINKEFYSSYLYLGISHYYEALIKKYKLFGQDGKGLYLLDTELGARVYTPPSLVL